MELELWVKEQEALLDQEIDEIVQKEMEDAYDPKRPVRLKKEKQRKKEELKKRLSLGYLDGDIDQAIELIYNLMPRTISPEEWNKIQDELFSSGESLKIFWEGHLEGKYDGDEPYYIMMGLSRETILMIYNFGEMLLSLQEPQLAKVIFGFLVILVPGVAAFWLALGRSYQFSEEFTDAVEVYNYGKSYDSNLDKLYLYCAECYELMGKSLEKERELEVLKTVLGNKQIENS